jgi:toluene monooxygenase system protein E
MTQRRTYWHLEGLGRRPSEYEIASSRLLYYVPRGFDVQTPLAAWYHTHQAQSRLRCSDFDAFCDPRQTTYARYVSLQRDNEVFVDSLLGSAQATGYDERLPPDWVALLGRVLGPLRYPVHGLQMVAAYIGSMAPSGKLAITGLLQAADEVRRTQRLAYRLCQLQQAHPACGQDSKQLWERDPAWQPLRELIERLLVVYDWGEAFALLNLLVKPAFDELFMVRFAELARNAGDDVLGRLLISLHEDTCWHREWSAALVSMVVADDPSNTETLSSWLQPWAPRVRDAMAAIAPMMTLPTIATGATTSL